MIRRAQRLREEDNFLTTTLQARRARVLQLYEKFICGYDGYSKTIISRPISDPVRVGEITQGFRERDESTSLKNTFGAIEVRTK